MNTTIAATGSIRIGVYLDGDATRGLARIVPKQSNRRQTRRGTMIEKYVPVEVL